MTKLSVLLPIIAAASLAPFGTFAEEALSNLHADSSLDELQAPGAGVAFARVFSTGGERTRLSSVVLEHFLFEPAQMTFFTVKLYRVYYFPGIPDPSLELAGVLGQYTPTAEVGGTAELNTLVSYYPSSPVLLEPNSLYAVAASESPEAGNAIGPYLQFTSSEEQRGLPGWQMGEELLGLDFFGFEIWMEPFQPGYLKFAINVEAAEGFNSPPDVSGAFATVSTVWPANGKMVSFQLQGVTDPDGDDVSVEISAIMQNEPVWTSTDKTAPDAVITGSDTGQIRGERLGTGTGRQYAVIFTASDGKPHGTVEGVVSIVVPHDEGSGEIPADAATASRYDSCARY